MQIPNENSRGANQYRPEQYAVYQVAKWLFPNCKVEMEAQLEGFYAVPDILITCSSRKIVVRMNGAKHDNSPKVRTKDIHQRDRLEQAGFKVVDFNNDDHAIVFKNPQSPQSVKAIMHELLKE